MSFLALGVNDALKHDYLAILVSSIYGCLIPIGGFAGICAAARSRDAYGTSERWPLAFIPLANLMLIFAKSQKERKSGFVGIATSIALVVIGLMMMMSVGRGISSSVERQVDRATEAAQNDLQVQRKAMQHQVEASGLEAALKEAAQSISVPKKLDAITTLKEIKVVKHTLRYIYEISDRSAVFSKNWNDLMTNRWCTSDNFKSLIEIGATLEGNYISDEGLPLAQLKINTEICNQWNVQFDKTMQDAAGAINLPRKLDDITTLVASEYKNRTFTYYYTVSATPPNNLWKDYLAGQWCKTDHFKTAMAFGVTVRGVYSTEAKAPIGEVLIDSAKSSALGP